MKRWFWMCVLPWLLAGCVLETFEVPAAYRPGHPGATAPVADGALFHGPLDPRQGGEITLHFVQAGPTRYVVEQLAAMPDGKVTALPPLHVHLVPLQDGHLRCTPSGWATRGAVMRWCGSSRAG